MWRRVLAVVTIFHFVCLCWIFFRAESVTYALAILAAITSPTVSTTLVTPWLLSLIALGLMVLSAVLPYYYFKGKGWL
jgi:D-alanyl-lipoteichoic acid acyltransferase DltB (MBOAT superfamily)